MKIKTKKKMDILELAQAVRDEEVKSGDFLNQENELINVDISGINLTPNGNNSGDHIVLFEDLFTVETLEELTEGTKIPHKLFALWPEKIYGAHITHGGSFGYPSSFRYPNGASITDIRNKHPEVIEVYTCTEEGRLIDFIWSREDGFADGILEVEE